MLLHTVSFSILNRSMVLLIFVSRKHHLIKQRTVGSVPWVFVSSCADVINTVFYIIV